MPLRFQLLPKQLLLKDDEDETRLEVSTKTWSKGNITELNQETVVALCNTQRADYGYLEQTLAESESKKLLQKQQPLSQSDNEAVSNCSNEQSNASNNAPTTSSLSNPQANNDSRCPGGAGSGKRSTSSIKSIHSHNFKNIKSQSKPDELINKTVTEPRLIEPQPHGSSISSATKQALVSSSYATSEPSHDTFINSHTYQRESFYQQAPGKKGSVEYTSQKRYRKRITYDEWLTNKKKLEAKRALERRNELNRIAEENEQRRLLADKSYADWLAKKLYASLPSSPSATSIISPGKVLSSANRSSTERKGSQPSRNARSRKRSRSNYSRQNMEKNVVPKHKGDSRNSQAHAINNRRSKSNADKIRPQRNSVLEPAKTNRGRGIGGRQDRQQSDNTELQNHGANVSWKQFFTKDPGKSVTSIIGSNHHSGATLQLYVGPHAFYNASSSCQIGEHNRNMSSQNGRRTVVTPRQRRQPTSATKSPVSTTPLSAAQRALRKRLDDMDGVTMMKQFKKTLT